MTYLLQDVVLQELCEALLEPAGAPPIQSNEVAEPEVDELVADDFGNEYLVFARGVTRGVQHPVFPVGEVNEKGK